MTKRTLMILGIILIQALVVSLVFMERVEAAAEETLNLGATLPFQSRIGIQLKNILNMNADIVNKAGGFTIGGKRYKISYYIYDDKYQADPARAAIEKLVFQDKIRFNVGTFGSAPTLAMLGVTEPNKIPIFGGAASIKLLTPDIKYFVHTYPSRFECAVIKVLRELKPDIKTVVLCNYDDETGHIIATQHEKTYKAYGIDVLSSLYFKHGETDFSRVASKVVSLNPNYFHVVAMVGAEYVQCIKALREAGYKGDIEAPYISQSTLDDIVEKIGKEGVEGVHVLLPDPTFSGLKEIPEGALEFRKNYEKYYGSWETEGLQWAGCWYTWLAAAKKANSLDPDKVMATIDRNFVVSTPFGPAKFYRRPDMGVNRYVNFASVVRVGIVKDGRITLWFEKDPDFMIKAIEEVYYGGKEMR